MIVFGTLERESGAGGVAHLDRRYSASGCSHSWRRRSAWTELAAAETCTVTLQSQQKTSNSNVL
jgi:hypothetical protein